MLISIVIFLAAFAVIAAFILGIDYLFWLLYTWVNSQIWPDNHSALHQPSFWLFFAVIVLISFISGIIFRHNK